MVSLHAQQPRKIGVWRSMSELRFLQRGRRDLSGTWRLCYFQKSSASTVLAWPCMASQAELVTAQTPCPPRTRVREPRIRASCRMHRRSTETKPTSLHQLPLHSLLRARQPGRKAQEGRQALCPRNARNRGAARDKAPACPTCTESAAEIR